MRNVFEKKLMSISRKIYDLMRVVKDDETNIRQLNEDAISSVILKEILSLRDDGFSVMAKSLELKESESGMDFDIWIGENDEKYIRLIVQAKNFKNNTKDDEYYENVKLEQCEKLIAQTKHKDYLCDKYEPIPFYFFYQHLASENIKEKYFDFIEDFGIEHTGITMTTAHGLKKLLKRKKCANHNRERLKFSEIHENKIEGNWASDLSIFDMVKFEDTNIGLPLHCLSDLTVEMVDKFNKLNKPSPQTSFGFFFFFPLGKDLIKIHETNSVKILELHEKNECYSSKIKNLIIIDDTKKAERDKLKLRESKLKRILNYK